VDKFQKVEKKEKSILPPYEFSPGKISSRSGPISVSLECQRDVFTAKGNVTGELQVSCDKDGVAKFGRIAVYLIGFEG
jgi:hypothetical protein